jgi:UDP-glucose 4-epimerase
MRVLVTGATGNVGTSVLESLAHDPDVSEVIGLARRIPELRMPKTRFVAADVTNEDLVSLFRGAQAVVHLAWQLQPRRAEAQLEAVNVRGSRRVFEAVVRAKVPQLVVASSVGAYAPGPKDRRVDERWPTTGIPTSLYSRQKARVERALDELEQHEPEVLITRLRPALIFKGGASSEIKGLFIGRWVPKGLLRSPMLRFVPDTPGFCFQAVHSLDVGDAFRLAVMRRSRGAFNIAAEPVLDTQRLVETLHAKPIRVPPRVLRGAVGLSYRIRLQPTHPGWIDLALNCPLMSTERASRELGWSPKHSAVDAVKELFVGLTRGAGMHTAPLSPESAP